MGRQGLEVDLAAITTGEHGRRQFIKPANRAQQGGLRAGRVVQQRALGGGAGVGDRLLVDDLGAGCAADLRQLARDRARLGQGERLRGLQDRHDFLLGNRQGGIIRPLRLIGECHRHIVAGVGDKWHDCAHRALVGQAATGLEEAGERVVVKPHAERDRRRDFHLGRGGVATAGAGDRDRSHAETVGIAEGRGCSAGGQLSPKGEGQGWCRGVSRAVVEHLNASHKTAAENCRGGGTRAATASDGDGRSPGISPGARGDGKAGGSESA